LCCGRFSRILTRAIRDIDESVLATHALCVAQGHSITQKKEALALKPVQLSVLVALALAMPISAFAQTADAGAASGVPAKKHKQLKYHGKNAQRAIAASAAGTNDAGKPN
jgi:hypothetical protein